ncbi:MAG: helix-turn-helix transcriptional regulator [Hylemonella sp.]|nr:helix-turn-helix transcriptional regulator [Hylemonella sp.]
MTHFAAQLKAEISRIARKEVRAETQGFKKASTQYRSDIAALKRQVATLERALAKLKKVSPGSRDTVDDTEAAALRFRAGGFASLRKKLGLSAAEMAALLGVSSQSVYHWETGKSRPRASQLPAIAALRRLGKREAAARLAAL